MLVTVVMTTYNDEKFIVKTLESVKAQTYKDIELVISDDKSPDNTVAVAQEWVEKNRDRFVDVKIIVPEENTGVTANCIRAVKASSGEWIKNLGGDNLIQPDCIEKFVKFVESNPEAELVQCNLWNIDENDNVIDKLNRRDSVFHDDRTTAEQQLELFKWEYCVDALGLFKKKSLLDSEECYDIEFRNQEDTPFIYRVLGNGHKIWWLNDNVILRRMRKGSLSGISDNKIISKNYFIGRDVKKKYNIKKAGLLESFIINYNYFLARFYYKRESINIKNGLPFFVYKILKQPVSKYTRLKILRAKKAIKASWHC